VLTHWPLLQQSISKTPC